MKRAMALAGVALVAGAGCVERSRSSQAALLPEPGPLTFDGTQQVRSGDPLVSTYANGDVVAGSTGQKWDARGNVPKYQSALNDVGVSAVNFVRGPYTLIEERGEIAYAGEQYEPSYTLMPAWPLGTDATPRSGTPVSDDATIPADTTAAPVDPAPTVAAGGDISIVGHVEMPGTYSSADGSAVTVSKLLAKARIAQADPTLVSITIQRGDDVSAPATLSDLIAGVVADTELQAGDIVTVTVK
jgi:hypothetical protein